MMTSDFVDNDDDNEYDVNDVDWEAEARDIQNRMSRAVGTTDREARHFREFFGTPVDAVEIVWDLLVRESLLPEKGRPNVRWSSSPASCPIRWKRCRACVTNTIPKSKCRLIYTAMKGPTQKAWT